MMHDAFAGFSCFGCPQTLPSHPTEFSINGTDIESGKRRAFVQQNGTGWT